MSRLISATSSVSLTEELDKLEQSITLTLQEIDHNFSRTHAIVNSSILPIVEKYATHSNAVWEGSKFWKQFFEASANVSLSGVEEKNGEEEGFSLRSPKDIQTFAGGKLPHSDNDTLCFLKEDEPEHHETDETFLENASITESTPRPLQSYHTYEENSFTKLEVSAEASEREKKCDSKEEKLDIVQTPSNNSKVSNELNSLLLPSTNSKNKSYSMMKTKSNLDPLLHRVLDKNYRLQATPHSITKGRNLSCKRTSSQYLESPDSSPPIAAPQLHIDLFSSPTRQRHNKQTTIQASDDSAHTPQREKLKNTMKSSSKGCMSWESDSEEDAEGIYKGLGISPPKTIQFILPQSKLLQTPAREASQRIVQDLLHTAGAAFDISDTDESSSMVVQNEIDDNFE